MPASPVQVGAPVWPLRFPSYPTITSAKPTGKRGRMTHRAPYQVRDWRKGLTLARIARPDHSAGPHWYCSGSGLVLVWGRPHVGRTNAYYRGTCGDNIVSLISLSCRPVPSVTLACQRVPCGGRTPRETWQDLPVDPLRQGWQDGATVNESEHRFSFTRVALSTPGVPKSKFQSCHHPVCTTLLRVP